MRQPITRPMHGLADYNYVAAAALAPTAAGFEEEEPTAAALCRAMAGAALVSTAMTRSEFGIVRVLPFRAHRALDLGLGVLALAAPWLMGFSRNARARNAFLMLGAGTLLATAMTRPEEMPAGRRGAAGGDGAGLSRRAVERMYEAVGA